MYRNKWIFAVVLLLLYSCQVVFLTLKIAGVLTWSLWLVGLPSLLIAVVGLFLLIPFLLFLFTGNVQ